MKRMFDVIGSVLLLLLLSPLLLVIAVLIQLILGWPVLFVQERPGLHGRPFRLYKFRTMFSAYGSDGSELPDERRLGKFGRFLRASSLDELPELWNVLCGDMSLVGPRPLLMEYVDLYTPRQAVRHDVRPGITGWAQVNGRNAITWEQKFEYDLWYVQNQSMWLDLRILARTLMAVAGARGVSQKGRATMERFKGKS